MNLSLINDFKDSYLIYKLVPAYPHNELSLLRNRYHLIHLVFNLLRDCDLPNLIHSNFLIMLKEW